MKKFFQVQRFTETINLTAENDEHTNRNSDKIINALGGADTIYSSADKVTVSGDAGSDLIINGQYFEKGGVNVELLGGENSDTITNSGAYSKIDGGAGDDLIHNGYYYYASWNAYYEGSGNDGEYNDSLGSAYTTIIGGVGNDSIYNSGDNVTINAGTGNNYIENYGKNVLVSVNGGIDTIKGDNITIAGSSNNDTLTGGAGTQTFQYKSGGGDDVIVNYSGEDVIHIASGKITGYSIDGDDLIFNIGDGSLTLKNMTNRAITVKNSSGKTSTKIYGTGYLPQQVIKNFVQSMSNSALDTKLILDEAIQLSSGFNSLQEVTDKMVADCRKAGNAEIFLRDYCGIDLNNEDTGAVTGWESGGSSIKTMEDLLPTVGTAKYPTSNSFTVRGLTFKIPAKNTLTENQQLVIKGLYSWWAEDAVKLIEDSYGIKFDGQEITVSFFDDSENFAWATAGATELNINMAFTTVSDSDKTGKGLNACIAHELTHTLQGNFNMMDKMPNYMTEGMADMTAGDHEALEELAGDSVKLAEYLDTDNDFSSDRNVYAAGYMFWHYFMKQSANSYDSLSSYAFQDNSKIVGTKSADFLTSNADKVTIKGGAGDDTITSHGENSVLNGGAGNDIIYNGYSYYDDDVKIYYNEDFSGSNSTVTGGKGNDKISLASYSENIVINYSSGDGKDIVFGFDSNDTLQISGSYSTVKSGYDIIVKVGKGSITFKDYDGDNIFITSKSSANLSELIADDSVGEFEFENKITTQENLITYTK